MKRILLLLLIIAASTQLKAQQLTFKPADSLLFKTPKNWENFKFKQGDSILLKGFSNLQKSNPLAMLQGLKGNKSALYGNMPVAKLQGTDRMPVAKLGDPNTHYTMLIKKIGDADGLAKVIPVNP
ncbi:MAG TPA: hypothetical protein VK668_21510 [Mucilaginibacter sp.]|nr:hypothetical protein [Mucilaginibacter sp.]